MSTCLPQNSTALGNSTSLAPSWPAVATVVRHHTLDRLQRLLNAWRSRRCFDRDLRGLSNHLLRDAGLEVEGRQVTLTPSWRGHTPR